MPGQPGQPGQPGMVGGPGGFGPPTGARRKGVPGWLWGFGGVALASALWAGALLATDGFAAEDPAPSLSGYQFHHDMCQSVDISAFEERFDKASDSDPQHYSFEDEALDESYCNLRLTDPLEGDYDFTYLAVSVAWHKKTDPEVEFAPQWTTYESRSDEDSTYSVESLEGIGQEAYLITGLYEETDRLNYAALAVRDSGLVISMIWDTYAEEETNPLSKDSLRTMLEKDMRSTMEKLRKPDPAASANPEESSAGIEQA